MGECGGVWTAHEPWPAAARRQPLNNDGPADTAALFASTPPLQENADHSVTSALILLLSNHPAMSSATFWSEKCEQAVGRPLQAQLDAARASCGVTVRCAPVAAAFHAICTAVSATSTCV